MNEMNRPTTDTGDIRKTAAAHYDVLPTQEFVDTAKDFSNMLIEIQATENPDVIAQNVFQGQQNLMAGQQLEGHFAGEDAKPFLERTWDELQNNAALAASVGFGAFNFLGDYATQMLANRLDKGEYDPIDAFVDTSEEYLGNLWEGVKTGDFKWDLMSPENRPSMQIVRKHMFGEKPNPDGSFDKEPTFGQELAAFGLDLGIGLLTGKAYGTAFKALTRAPGSFVKAFNKLFTAQASEELGERISPRALVKLAEIADEKLTNVIKYHRAGDERATQQLVKYLNDPSVLEVIGDAYSRKILGDDFLAPFTHIKNQDLLTIKKNSIKAIESLYEKGVPQLALKELNNDFLHKGHVAYYQTYFAKRYLDINGPKDLDNLLGDMFQHTETFLEKAFKNAAKKGDRRTLKQMNDLLEVQKDVLYTQIGSTKIIVPMDNVQAFTYNKALNLIAHSMEAMLRSNDYVFASGHDMLRFWKLWSIRQQIVANLTGQKQTLAPMMRILYTGNSKMNHLVRNLILERALKAVPGISPRKATMLGELAGTNLRQGRVTAEEMMDVYSYIDEMAKQRQGLPGQAMQAALQIRKHFPHLDPKTYLERLSDLPDAANAYSGAIGTMIQTLQDAGRVNSFLNELTKGGDYGKLYRRYIVNLLYPMGIHATNFVTNATMTLLSPAFDLSAAAMALFKGDVHLAVGNAGRMLARTVGFVHALYDMSRVAGSFVLKPLPDQLLRGSIGARNLAEGRFRFKAITAEPAAFRTGQEVVDPSVSFTKDTVRNMDWKHQAMYYMSRLYHAPPRLMADADMTFKALIDAGERYSQAWFKAWTEAEDMSEARQLFHLYMHRSEETAVSSWKMAEASTFTEDLTDLQNEAIAGIKRIPGARWLFPFMRTPLNVMRTAANLTPGFNLIPLVMEPIVRPLKRFGWGDAIHGVFRRNKTIRLLNGTEAERQTAIGTLAFTNGLFAGVLFAPTEGIITGSGGIPMPNDRNIPYEPYTFFYNGEKYYYGDNVILKVLLGIPLSLKEAYQQIDWTSAETAEVFDAMRQASLFVMSDIFSNSFGFKTMAKLADGLRAMIYRGDGTIMAKEITRMILATAFPGVVRDVSKAVDPMLREYDNIWQRLMAQYGIGLYSQTFPLHIDLFGGIRYQNLFDHQPQVINIRGNEPWVLELRKIRPNLKDAPKTTTTFIAGDDPFAQRDYTANERAMMNRFMVTGEGMPQGPFQEAVKSLMSTDLYLGANYKQRKEILERLNSEYRKAAETRLLQLYGNSLAQ